MGRTWCPRIVSSISLAHAHDSAISPAAISVAIGTGLEQSDRHRIGSMKLTLSILKIISGDFWNLVGGILRNALF